MTLSGVGRVFHAALIESPAMAALMLLNAGTLLLAVIGLFIDPRFVLNAPVWAKTFKFSISILVYGGTLAWMLTFLRSKPRLRRFVGTATSVALSIEIVLILIQALRGQPMHFNYAPGIDLSLWVVMSITIFALFVVTLVAAFALARERLESRALGVGIKLGLIVAIIGLGLGFLMTGPNATQMAALESGRSLTMIGAHNVNALVDGQTRMIPILGWNMDGGDLRIPHFVGIHALQIVPLMALFASRIGGLSPRRQTALVWIGAAFYFGLTMLVTWQALRDQSIVAPDAQTLTAAAVLIGVTALPAALIGARR